MDYQNHQHQIQQWRHRPPHQPNATPCPTCSFPHFPFCPPHPNPHSFHSHPPPPYDHHHPHKRPTLDHHHQHRRLQMVRDHGSSPPTPSWNFDPRNHGGPYFPTNHPSSYYPPPQPPLPSLFPVDSPNPDAARHPPPLPCFNSKSFMHSSTAFDNQDWQGVQGMLPKQYVGEDWSFPPKIVSSDYQSTVVDASQLFKSPHRSNRPDHFVIILRGLPGSGKSYLAKMLRDIEVEYGGPAPRVHSMDDYFMTEVEKVEECDISKPLASVRGKKPVVKRVMEYCYEPEMEEAYRSSMLKAFRKTLEEGAFTFIIVDDRNLRKADFAQFWATAKSSGYEVYILEASYKDPAGCAARNVHGFTLDDIQKMAGQWEEAPPFQLRLDVKSLFSGDDLKTSGIQEVDMEEENSDEIPSELDGQNTYDVATPVEDDPRDDSLKDGEIGDAAEVKELGRSKWSNELEEENTEQTKPTKGKINALSGLIQAYGKEGKSVRWGDKGGSTGFSISAAKKASTLSIVIGPGAGYNLKSNPLCEQNRGVSNKSNAEPKKQKLYQEQLRAEHEYFKAAFSRRQVRIGLDMDEE